MTTKPVWEPITIAKALSLCDFDALYVAMNLAFACSLRIGEILGLTWNDIHFAEDDDGASWLHVTKTLLEVSRQSVAATEGRDILMVFPSTKPNSSMSLILKKPKTKNSIRKVYLPRTIADILKAWHTRQLELIDLLGADYQNYNLVLAQNSGKPYDSHQIYKLLKTFIHAHQLPDVTFHSLRHSSVTYKLALNDGNIKLVQGDTGHASPKLMLNTYAEIFDQSSFAAVRTTLWHTSSDVENPSVLSIITLIKTENAIRSGKPFTRKQRLNAEKPKLKSARKSQP